MYPRWIEASISEALKDTPVIYLSGPRQTGKTTLAQKIHRDHPDSVYFNFDDLSLLNAAKENPKQFLQPHKGLVILDEVQHVPELFLVIKWLVDQDRRPGRFLLTGSANALLLPKVADSLAGRMEILPLYPLSWEEISSEREGLIEGLFSAKPPSQWNVPPLEPTIIRGGFPEAYAREDPARRERWFTSYLAEILQKDVRELSRIEEVRRIPNLLQLLATRSGGLLNFEELSRTSGLPSTTLRRYFQLLEMLFLVYLIPAWSNHLGKRLVKKPKVFLNDTGLLCHLLGTEELNGNILESAIVSELCKRISWSRPDVKPYHFRTPTGYEVDLVLEQRNRQLVGIEVKSTSNVNSHDFRGLKALKEMAGKNFHRGYIFYRGDQLIPFGDDLYALPMKE